MNSIVLVLVCVVVSVVAEYNSTAIVGSKGPYCYPESGFDDCLEECPKPSSGATCDSEMSGVNLYWCVHFQLIYSNRVASDCFPKS